MRTSIAFALLLLATALPAAAQDKAKPNTLTPKEIADGWILLFDGETTFGLIAEADQKRMAPEVALENGQLLVSGKSKATFSTRFDCFELLAEYRTDGAFLKKKGNDFALFDAVGVPRGDKDRSASFGFTLAGEQWGRLAVRLAPNSLTRNDAHGKRSSEDHEVKEWDRGTFQFVFEAPFVENTKLMLRDVKMRPLETKPLFNAKDLTGWKPFPGKKSFFTVEDGAIVCKNGPGDLQTEAQYANFVLQLECKSNGKHLNSGIFFRCKANEYQNGYEAQIHNNFTADPAKEYTVEEYDPKTHELTGKKKVKSAAVDFGTGAIYRRVPARKQTAKDGEWFTMTIVAHGNHIATWVNGIQQVDWYDNRPASDNPRLGCRLEAGHISIQGHDPTTDLSFRNIRIAELP